MPFPGGSEGLRKFPVDRDDIGTVDPTAGDTVRRPLGREGCDGGLPLDGERDGPLVVRYSRIRRGASTRPRS